jgi:hypothetical protein
MEPKPIGNGVQRKNFEPDADHDFEVVLERPLDVLVEVEMGVWRQMRLSKIKDP